MPLTRLEEHIPLEDSPWNPSQNMEILEKSSKEILTETTNNDITPTQPNYTTLVYVSNIIMVKESAIELFARYLESLEINSIQP